MFFLKILGADLLFKLAKKLTCNWNKKTKEVKLNKLECFVCVLENCYFCTVVIESEYALQQINEHLKFEHCSIDSRTIEPFLIIVLANGQPKAGIESMSWIFLFLVATNQFLILYF